MIQALSSEKTTRSLLACCIIQIAACIYLWSSFAENGYLPSPFIYDKSDTFMDLFHPMYWADEPGRYTDWGSVYPPLNFLFLRGVRWLWFGLIHESDAFTLRDSASPFISSMVIAYAAALLFAFRHDLWRGFTAIQKALLVIICLLSPPMLFTIERGNLIIFVLGFLALALAKPGWTRIFAIGILINIKPYFALYLVAFAISQKPKELICCTLMAGVIFLLSGIVLDEHFLEFVWNILQFSQDQNLFSGREALSLPSSVSAFAYVLRTYIAQGGTLSVGDLDINSIIGLIESAKWLTLIAAFFSLALAGHRLPTELMLAATTVAITNLGIWVGGYSFILYVCLIPIFWRLTYHKIYLACVFLIFMPIDVISLLRDNIGNHYAYISDATVSVDWDLGLGVLLRPIVNFCLLLTISLEIFKNYAPSPRDVAENLARRYSVYRGRIPLNLEQNTTRPV